MEFPPVVWGIELSETLADTKMIAEAVGRRRPLPGRPVPGLALVGVERPVPRRRPPLRARRPRPDRRRRDAHRGQRRHLPGRVGRGPINSVNFITATTASRSTTSSPTTRSTTRPTARATATASTTTSAGTAAPRARPTTPASTRCASGRSRTSPRSCLSQGVPMFVAGDEVRRTQHGNNNAYCQDNEISWFDWTLVEENADLLRFFQRDDRPPHAGTQPAPPRVLHRRAERRGVADIRWHGARARQPGLGRPRLARPRVHAGAASTGHAEPDLHVMMNMDDSPHDFAVPPLDDRQLAALRRHREAVARRHRRSPARSGRSRASATRVAGRSIVILDFRKTR